VLERLVRGYQQSNGGCDMAERESVHSQNIGRHCARFDRFRRKHSQCLLGNLHRAREIPPKIESNGTRSQNLANLWLIAVSIQYRLSQAHGPLGHLGMHGEDRDPRQTEAPVGVGLQHGIRQRGQPARPIEKRLVKL
jgi:hypothetical protein